MPHPKDLWNARYDEDGLAYGEAPNVFFRETLATLPPGRLLLPAEGEGRHALHAAKAGWEVHAFDFSEVAQGKALRLAAAQGLEIAYTLEDFATVKLPEARYDAVGLVFAHMPEGLRTRFHAEVASTLKPGGTLILQAYHVRQLMRGTGGPDRAELLYTAEALRRDFQGLEILRLEEHVAELSEGKLHRGLSELVSFVGRKR